MEDPLTGLEVLGWDDLMLEDMALQVQVGQQGIDNNYKLIHAYCIV